MVRCRLLLVAAMLLASLSLALGCARAQASGVTLALGAQSVPRRPGGSSSGLPGENHLVYLPLAVAGRPLVRIAGLHYDTTTPNEPDEAFQLWNVSERPVNLEGYRVSDGRRSVLFPPLALSPGTAIWCTAEAEAFHASFGAPAGCEYAADTDPAAPDLAGTGLRFANSGGQVQLFNPAGALVDVLVYEGGDVEQAGWQGPAVEPYSPSNTFPAEGQILYRKQELGTGQPLGDTDSRLDWAQDPGDSLAGRRVLYPGWDLDRFAWPPQVAATGVLTVALAPDNFLDVVSRTLASAQHSIRIESYTFEHPALAELLAQKASSGVSVTLLLEGGPVGGIGDAQRHATQLIEAAGGQVWYMTGDSSGARPRYAYQHAKFALVDERLLLVSSENPGFESMPGDDRSDGTQGRRGSAMVTDDQALVARALAIFRADLDPAHHRDLLRWTAGDPEYGGPPPDYFPEPGEERSGYQPVHPEPLAVSLPFMAQLVSAPEAGLLPPEAGGVLGLVALAGEGDTVLVEMLYERVHWGGARDTPETAPNPRLAAHLDAARRGAAVRILLDGFFDHGDNVETVAYLKGVAAAEGLDLVARTGNPTGQGIHNKMVLVQAGGLGWAHVGSLNGSEASAKVNRELALQVQSNAVHDYLAAAFWHDWEVSIDTP